MSNQVRRDPQTGQFTTNSENPWTDEEVLQELYWEQELSLQQIANRFGLESDTTILSWMEKFDIPRRRANDDKPPAYCWERGWPVWSHSISGTHYTVRVHRLTAVAEYGFEAVSDNDVHHKNGIKWDNRPSNLEPIDHAEHTKLHRSDGGIVRGDGDD